jgi:hypothetical protein
MRLLVPLSLCLFSIAACADADSDGKTLSSSACAGAAQDTPCPGGCPATWSTDPARLCRPPNAVPSYLVQYTTDCQGFDVVNYHGVDRAVLVIYRAGDGQLLGVEDIDGNRRTHTCVAGVPDSFDATDCPGSWTSLTCPTTP